MSDRAIGAQKEYECLALWRASQPDTHVTHVHNTTVHR